MRTKVFMKDGWVKTYKLDSSNEWVYLYKEYFDERYYR